MPFEVATYEDLKKVGSGVDGWNLNSNYIQVADIQCPTGASQESFESIGGTFTGIYNGQNYKIKNFYISQATQYAALFHTNEGELKNIQLEDVDITVNVAESYSYVSGICIWTYAGFVDNCHILSGSITGNGGFVTGIANGGSNITNCTNNATISGGNIYTAGIVGEAGDICNCINYGVVSYSDWTGGIAAYLLWNGVALHCRNEGALTGFGSDCGGIVGWNEGTVRNCTNTGAITGVRTYGIVGRNYGTIEDCSNYGNMTATSEYTTGAGGIVGYHEGGIVRRCVNYGDISGDQAGGIARYAYPLEDCYNHGNVAGDTYSGGVAGNVRKPITRCYTAGLATGAGNTGAFAGQVSGDGAFQDCYFDTTIGGATAVGLGDDTGITGMTTDQLTSPYDANAYTNWDFVEIWRNHPGDYAVLKWQPEPITKYGTLKFQTTGGVITTPLVNPDDLVPNMSMLRIGKAGDVMSLQLVSTCDSTYASPLRVKTPSGIYAFRRVVSP